MTIKSPGVLLAGGLARRMGFREDDAEAARERMLREWGATRACVRAHFDELLPEKPR